MKTIDFNNLVGESASLYYNNNLNQFQLGSVIFEVVENEDDGYRSSMSGVGIIKEDAKRDNKLDDIIITSSSSIDGYELVGTNGFVWLIFGTRDSDDYYPSFVFEPNAQNPESSIIKLIK